MAVLGCGNCVNLWIWEPDNEVSMTQELVSEKVRMLDRKEMGTLYDHQALRLGYSSCLRVRDNGSIVHVRSRFIRAIARRG